MPFINLMPLQIFESMLDSTIRNDAIRIKGYSQEVFRNDHPSNSKTGGVCLYFRDGLPIKRRDDLEVLQEMIVSEATISRKKIFLINLYRSPSQNSEQNILNKLIDKTKFTNIPPILENGLFVTNLEAKANLFNDYFVEQCCAIATGSTLPAFDQGVLHYYRVCM